MNGRGRRRECKKQGKDGTGRKFIDKEYKKWNRRCGQIMGMQGKKKQVNKGNGRSYGKGEEEEEEEEQRWKD